MESRPTRPAGYCPARKDWDQLVSFELRLCQEPGVLDAGTHILAAIRR